MPLRLLVPLLLLAVAAGGAATGGAAASEASSLLYERTLMAQAGARCRLFSPQVLGALDASRLQARGAALRAGDGGATVAATQARAGAKAASVDCRDAGLRTAAERVRQAFADYAQLQVMRFPGPLSAWRAERPNPRLRGLRWSLVEPLPGTRGWMLFGLVDGRPALLDARRGATPASFARVEVRDPARLDAPYLNGAPPPSIARAVLASNRAPAAQALLPAGARSGVLYSFPPELAVALAALDPREQVGVALAYPGVGRERTDRAAIEVGDFAAARAFLSSGAPAPAR